MILDLDRVTIPVAIASVSPGQHVHCLYDGKPVVAVILAISVDKQTKTGSTTLAIRPDDECGCG